MLNIKSLPLLVGLKICNRLGILLDKSWKNGHSKIYCKPQTVLSCTGTNGYSGKFSIRTIGTS